MLWNLEGGSITWKGSEEIKSQRAVPHRPVRHEGMEGIGALQRTCLQWARCLHRHQLSWGLGHFPSICCLKTSTNSSMGSREKGLLRDIELSLGESSAEEEDPEKNCFRVWNATPVSSSAPDVKFSPSARGRTHNLVYNMYFLVVACHKPDLTPES